MDIQYYSWLTYSKFVIIRLVNAVIEKTRKKEEMSIAEAAAKINMPHMLIDIRHGKKPETSSNWERFIITFFSVVRLICTPSHPLNIAHFSFWFVALS